MSPGTEVRGVGRGAWYTIEEYTTCRAYNIPQTHDVSEEGKKNPITPNQWNAVREIEACMFLSRPVSRLVQAEQHSVDTFR